MLRCMDEEKLAKAIIAAALIQGGQFPSLLDFNQRGEPVRRRADDHDPTHHVAALADAVHARNWREIPMFVMLNKLTNAFYAASTEPLQQPEPSIRSS